MAFFVCKLNPPRPSFAFDMTESERAVMEQHSAYLRRLSEEGAALLFGPVGDPRGPWGLGIFEVEDEYRMRAITAADPAITAAMGFTYEIMPMMQAVVGKRIGRTEEGPPGASLVPG
ncbi:YciI family protein [Labrys monachus]|uniref:Uncharacterized protein YciI n=1 Tax=Labrys monachus TaxID=217067 RepID=A0ABU0FDL0_9HYPH|nr:YciI family protein [Labrys monachus]MDQ0392417.1 uncharacterized protein YciI [Labrys monachus]